MKTNKDALIERFTSDTRKMAEALVHGDDWGYWHNGGVCNYEKDAIEKEIEWLESEYIEPEPPTARDTTVSIPVSIAEYIRRQEANP